MTQTRRIDPALTDVLELYAFQIIQRTRSVAGLPNEYSIAEHQTVSETLDMVLESYCDDAAKLDELTGRKRIKHTPTVNEFRRWMGKPPAPDGDDSNDWKRGASA
jgi:hypothetical protein